MRTRILTCLLLVPTLAWASGQSNAGNSSQNSGGSEGSGQSSQQSGAGSQGTGQSSENMGQSSGQSQSDSSQASSQGTSAEVVVVVSAIAVTGATVAFGVWAVSALSFRQLYVADARMLRYLREHHALVARDVIAGDGIIFDGWYVALGLSEDERALMKRALDASDEQASMLAALDGVDSVEQARRFAGAFVSMLHRALGEARVKALVETAAQGLS